MLFDFALVFHNLHERQNFSILMNGWHSSQNIENAFDALTLTQAVEFENGGLFEKRRGEFASG